VTDSNLDTPSIAVPVAPSPVFVKFWHSYNLENGRDGGVVEISIDGGPFTDIVAAGGSADYDGPIATGFLSPIAGRHAWTGNSGGMVAGFVSLPQSAQGHNAVLRFRLATDCSGAGTGWYVDSIMIYYFFQCCPTPTPPPPSPTPTATTPPPTATPIATPCGVTFSENFDGVTAPALPAGWTNPVTGSGVEWRTSTVFPTSGTNDALGLPGSGVGNADLITPVITAPSTGGILSFQNLFNFSANPPPSSGFDGMVLEISINGGSFSDITSVGGSFIRGGYTHTIAGGFGSPIAFRMAWSGVSAGSTAAPDYITSTVMLPASVNGQNIRFKWRVASDSVGVFAPGEGARIDSIILTPVGCVTPTPTPTPTPTVTPATPTPTPAQAAQAVNLSTRMRVGTADNVGIGGFIITGTGPKQVLLRAIGPSLTQFGVPNPLANPVLELRGSDGVAIIINDDWEDDLGQMALILATGLAPTNDLESAIVATLNPGAYTAIVRGNGNSSGVALVEVYDLAQSAPSRLGNISTRASVSTGDDIVIAGFILGNNSGADRIIARGMGPSLGAAGVPGALSDPALELRDSNGALLIANNDWQDENLGMAGQLIAAGLAPPNPLEAGIVATLPPGSYTALLAGRNDGTGIGLVEVYDLGGANVGPLPTPSPSATSTPSPNQSPTPTPTATATGTPIPTPTPTPTPSGTPTPTAAPCGIPDGGFETGGIPSTVWNQPQTSIQFGTPLCDNAFCANINGPPRTGSYWVWFGGMNGFEETATLGQNVVIPSAGAVSLHFWMRIALVNTPLNDVLNVRVDGTVVQSYPEPADLETEYTERIIDLSAFANGAAHNIEFEYIAPDNGVGNSSYLVDDVSLLINGACPSASPSPTPTATPCVGTVLTENFDGVAAPTLPEGWRATNSNRYGYAMWVTTTTNPDTAPNNVFIADRDGVSDKRLDTRPIVISSASAQLSFRNRYHFEYEPPPNEVLWDGGVLEVSSPNINGGAFTDVTDPAVGGSFVSGGYTGVIDTTAGNPLAGRMAWCGDSNGYLTTVVNLGSNVNGQTIRLRFRMGTDEAVAAPGWHIDTISVDGACP